MFSIRTDQEKYCDIYIIFYVTDLSDGMLFVTLQRCKVTRTGVSLRDMMAVRYACNEDSMGMFWF